MIKWERITQEEKEEFESGIPSPMSLSEDTFHPVKIFQLFFVKTDFKIMTNSVLITELIEGVEVIRPVSRYQIVIGIGELFNLEHVQEKVEAVLTGSNTEILKVDSIKNQDCRSEVIKAITTIKQDFDYWAVLVIPDGTIKAVKDNYEDEFNKKLKELEELQNVSGGEIIRHSNTTELY